MLRSLICVFVGHVDHGKTSILDQIRGTKVTAQEAGAITQHISCTKLVPEKLQKICKNLKDQVKIPGLLFLDTPGHEAFTTLRKRGGNLADVAILVIDINEGLKPQTIEAIEILKHYKTPFIIAANKIDTLSQFRKTELDSLLENINQQSQDFTNLLDTKVYELVGKLAEHGFNAERFDRVEDYTKQIAIVPTSAKFGLGIPELLMIISGLAQKFLEKKLEIDKNIEGKAIILEKKDTEGLGKTIDIILYDGRIKENDTIVIGNTGEPIVTKIKAMFEEDKKLIPIKEAEAAIALKISAPNLDHAIVGMPVRVANKNLEETKEEVQKEIEEVLIEADNEGIIIKADTIGSLEALTKLLKEKNILIKKALIGDVTKNDLANASAEENPLFKVILAFNVKPIETKEVKIIHSDVIYKVVEDIEKFQETESKRIEQEQLGNLVKPFKLQVLKNCIFHISHPAIVGVEVLAGKLKSNTKITKDGSNLTEVKEIQLDGKNVKEAEKGKQVAISLPNITAGRQVKELDILYSNIPESDFRKLKEFKSYLNPAEVEILRELASLKRKTNATWGV
ncbi:MAG: translation initiation factor IF-2 [Nanoarchaeota archaeon]